MDGESWRAQGGLCMEEPSSLSLKPPPVLIFQNTPQTLQEAEHWMNLFSLFIASPQLTFAFRFGVSLCTFGKTNQLVFGQLVGSN